MENTNIEVEKYIEKYKQGDESVLTKIVDLAKQSMGNDKFIKLESFYQNWIKMGAKVALETFNKGDKEIIVKLMSEFLRFFPFSKFASVFLCLVKNTPEFLYKGKEIVSPDFYNYVYNNLLECNKGDVDIQNLPRIEMENSSLFYNAFMEQEDIKVENIHKCNWYIVYEHVKNKAKELGWGGY